MSHREKVNMGENKEKLIEQFRDVTDRPERSFNVGVAPEKGVMLHSH